MKKTVFAALVCMFGCLAGFADTSVITNVYDMSMSLKTPVLYNGVRSYKSQSYKGYLYAEYTDSELTALTALVKSSGTKVIHQIEFSGDSFYHLMGKTTKTSDRSEPTIYLEGADVANEGTSSKFGNHETIKKIQLAGGGSLKAVKSVTVGCSACGEAVKTTAYCNILVKASGYVTGIMDCECPEDEDWWHTVKTALCGVFYDANNDVERDHDAAFVGSWKLSFNKKLSDTKIK